jgi:hypothetical protein
MNRFCLSMLAVTRAAAENLTIGSVTRCPPPRRLTGGRRGPPVPGRPRQGRGRGEPDMRFQLRLVAALWIASIMVVGTFG